LAVNTTGTDNTALGYNALAANATGTSNNTAIGSSALAVNTTGTFNVAVGKGALAANTTGVHNIAVGYNSLVVNTTGADNTVLGYNALVANTTGVQNTAIGSGVGAAITTGTNNIIVGYNAGGTLTTGSGNIYINANAGAAAETNTTRIGTSQTACFVAGIFGATVIIGGLPVDVDSSGHLGTIVSSKRFKKNIADMAVDSENIYNLRPVSFSYISDDTDTKQYGLIAEEVAEIFPSLVVYDCDEQPLSVRYQVLPILLLNEVQKQHEIIEKLEQQGEEFSCAMDSVHSRLLALEHN